MAENRNVDSTGRFAALHTEAEPQLVWEDNIKPTKRQRRKSAKGKLQNGGSTNSSSSSASNQSSSSIFHSAAQLVPISEAAVLRSSSAEPSSSPDTFSLQQPSTAKPQRQTADEVALHTTRRPLSSLSFQELRPSRDGETLQSSRACCLP